MSRRMPMWAIDIETVSQGNRANEWTEQAPVKLGNIKDPTKIAQKEAEKRDEMRSKHGLHWITGKIVCATIVNVWGDEVHQFYGRDEVKILHDLSAYLEEPCYLIGKNSKTFDFPFLIGRYMAQYMRVPRGLKEWSRLLDVDDFFGRSAASTQRTTLNGYAHGVNYNKKPMDGASVQGVYDNIIAAEIEKDETTVNMLWKQLLEYNKHDCEVVRAMAVLYYNKEDYV